MGKKGSRLTTDAVEMGERLANALEALGSVTHRKMFGGVGLFESGAMFGIIDSTGRAFLKADDVNRKRFEDAGSERHGKMPYYSVPDAVLEEPEALLEWARTAEAAARRGKK